MPDGEAVVVEVKGTPFQTDNLTAAQAVKSSQKNYQFDLMPLDDFKQIQDFRIQVVVTLEGFRLGMIIRSAGLLGIRFLSTA